MKEDQSEQTTSYGWQRRIRSRNHCVSTYASKVEFS